MAGTLTRSKGKAMSKGRTQSDGPALQPDSSNPAPVTSGNPSPAAPGRPDYPRTTALKTPRESTAPAAPRTTGLRNFAEANEHETQVVTFQLGREEYAIDILQVQEIVMMTQITRMPKAPHFIEGIVNLRGQMIPIIDMRKRFGLARAEHDSDTRIIIVDIGETVGMVVDGVRDVIRLPDSAISPPPPMIQGISADYLKGIGQLDQRLLIMLDLEKVLTADEQEVLRTLEPDGSPLAKE